MNVSNHHIFASKSHKPRLLLLTVKVWGCLCLSRSWGGVLPYWHAPAQLCRVCGGAWLQHGSSRRQVPPQQTTTPQQRGHSTAADTGGAAKQSPDRGKQKILISLRFKDSKIGPQKKYLDNITQLLIVVDICYVLTLQKFQHIFRIAEVSMHCCKPEVFTLDIFANISTFLSLSGLLLSLWKWL